MRDWDLPVGIAIPFLLLAIVVFVIMRQILNEGDLPAKEGIRADTNPKLTKYPRTIIGVIVTPCIFLLDAVAGFPNFFDVGNMILRVGYVLTFLACAYSLIKSSRRKM